MAQTGPGLGKSPTNMAVARSGRIRPCKSLCNRTNGPLGNHLARPRVDARSRASIGGIGPSIPSTTARGMAQTGPGLGKSPTNEAVARSGRIRPCKSLCDRTNGHLGNHLARPRVDARSRASIGGIGPSIPSPTARGMAQTAPGLGKSPTNEAVARSGPATAKSARAKVYAIGPMDLWATIKLGHRSAYAAKQA